MEKYKLLISFVSLAFVLSLNACDTQTKNYTDFDGEENDDTYKEPIVTPSDIVEMAYNEGNYSVEVHYLCYASEDTLTSDEYDAALKTMNDDDTDYDALKKYYALPDSGMVIDADVTMQIYYDTDYIYVTRTEGYYFGGGSKTEILLNADDGLWAYYSYDDGLTWNYTDPFVWKQRYGAQKWEEIYYSLFSAYEDGLADDFVYYPESDVYNFDDWSYSSLYERYISEQSADWLLAIGGEFWFGDSEYARDYALEYPFKGTFVDETRQELTSLYGSQLYGRMHGYGEIHYIEENYYFTIYDVGETDERETVESVHNYVQTEINKSD